MAQAVRRSPVSFLLNTDGRRHPVENRLVAVTAVLGVVAFVTGFFSGLSLIASWAGLLGIVSGGWGQMISATTGERFALVVSMGAAAVGFYLGMSNGGLFG
ncbi:MULTISPECIES: hypothetical protein [Streptomyces]|uniref:hypothetical protein n=1 Tax=Streptomyces TaxID=1883 RepID=UPI000C6DFB01|nr:hypothetical protein [Streptomyces barkulensis]